MAPTFRSSDLLLTRKVDSGGLPAQRGDVVVLRRDRVEMIKRVVGVPGDRVELEAGRLSVNGQGVGGRRWVRGASRHTWWVPAGSYFMAGDNLALSNDSRVWDRPFVAFSNVDAVVTRRLVGWPHRRRRLTPRRPVVATGRVV